MKHCIDCKYIGMGLQTLTSDPEYDSICLHYLAKRGDPSMVMKTQVRVTCYNMRKNADCGLDAKLFEAKPKDKVDE